MRIRLWSVPGLQQTGEFHAAGAFGSSDGIGGEGSFASASEGEGEALLAVGDSSGRLYVLSPHIKSQGHQER